MSNNTKTLPRLGFLYNPDIPDFERLGKALKAQYGDATTEEADVLVPIGGDGSVIFALPLAKGRTIYGLVPKESSSVAYTMNDYDPAEDLLASIEDADKAPVYPLNVVISYADGQRRTLDVFNSINIVRDSGQAAFMDLTGSFNGMARTMRLVGDGVAFCTPLGSTALGYSYDGPILNYKQPAIIFTGMGIGTPRGLNPIVAMNDDHFSVKCIVSKGKRPLRIDIDGNTHRPPADNHFTRVDIRLGQTPAAMLAVKGGVFHPFKRVLDMP